MQDDTTTESAAISARTKGDQQLSEVLLNEVLPAGALPEAPTSTVEGQKALAEAFNGAVATKKKKEKNEETTVEEAEPKSAEEYETQYFLYQKIVLTFKRSLTLKLPKREWTTHSMWLLFEEQVEGIAYNATIGFLYCVVWYRSSGCLKYNYTSYLPIPPDTKIQSNISGLWMREWRSA